MLTPVALPPGRLKLATRPYWTGSDPLVNTMGIVAVAAFAAEAEGLSVATSIATCRRTSSAARTGKRSSWPSAKRYSIAMFRWRDRVSRSTKYELVINLKTAKTRLHRKVGGLLALEDAIHIGRGLPPLDQIVAAIGHQAAVGREKSIRVDGR